MVEQVAEALVGLLGGAEAGELAHRPQPPAVHRRVDAARERELARIADLRRVIGDVLRPIQRLDRLAGERRALGLLGILLDRAHEIRGPKIVGSPPILPQSTPIPYAPTRFVDPARELRERLRGPDDRDPPRDALLVQDPREGERPRAREADVPQPRRGDGRRAARPTSRSGSGVAARRPRGGGRRRSGRRPRGALGRATARSGRRPRRSGASRRSARASARSAPRSARTGRCGPGPCRAVSGAGSRPGCAARPPPRADRRSAPRAARSSPAAGACRRPGTRRAPWSRARARCCAPRPARRTSRAAIAPADGGDRAVVDDDRALVHLRKNGSVLHRDHDGHVDRLRRRARVGEAGVDQALAQPALRGRGGVGEERAERGGAGLAQPDDAPARGEDPPAGVEADRGVEDEPHSDRPPSTA